MAAADERRLTVLLGGRRVGTVAMDDNGRFGLTDDEQWRESRDATPLSLSMPLTRPEHSDATVRAFLWGLLPDNEQVLERWAQAYQVSARNPFALLRHVGEDCAGAAQFVAPDRVDAILSGDGGIDWLTEKEVASRLRLLRRDPAAWHPRNAGQFSLAGAQAKTALYRDPATARWGQPWGSVPTTHILKPAVTGLDDHDLNEHLCLVAARLVGLPAAQTRVEQFDGERVIVVDRYDRAMSADGTVVRIHQEDLCQALGVPPTTKYQNEGGPAPEQIIGLLRTSVVPPPAMRRSIWQFVAALALNWVIGGSDAHAKNYSVLLAGAQVRLGPLYDVASALVYDEIYAPKLKMAMRIGGEYRMEALAGRHWRRFANANGLDPDETIATVLDVVDRTPDAFAAAAADKAVRQLRSKLPNRMQDQIAQRAERCRAQLDR